MSNVKINKKSSSSEEQIVVNKPVEVKKELSTSEQIWNEIKGVSLELFGLPAQPAENFCNFINVNPSQCFLTIKVSGVLPVLEAAIGPKYNCERADKYVIISRVNNYGA